MDYRQKVAMPAGIQLKGKRVLYNWGKYQSGQMGQTVNLLAYAFGGSNPSLPTKIAEVAQSIEH